MIALHRSEDATALLDALASILALPSDDPFAAEVVALPNRGLERWLAQGLSTALGTAPDRRDGICANVEFPALTRLTAETAGRASGIDPIEDPWPPERLVWALLEVTGTHRNAPWLQELAPHLDPASGRRFAQLSAIARLYHRYGFYRPDLIRRWAADELTTTERNGWQAPLWQALRAHLTVPSPAERLLGACAQLCEHPELAELPARISVFGLRNLPPSQAELLRALSVHRELHIFLMHPSDAFWRAANTTSPAIAANRLLASWGRETQALQSVVGPLADHDHYHRTTRAGTGDPINLLGRLQSAIAADQAAPGPPLGPEKPDQRPVLDPDDDSVAVHSCHGAARQVEVLREAILHRLAADQTLECRDILVICPDIERFAPLIDASFAEAAEAPGRSESPPSLPVRIADRAAAQTNPLLGVLARLLELADGRLTAEDVLDFADREPVRARFRFDDDEVAKLRDWARETAVHWGLSETDRARRGLAGLDIGTWRFGLRRLLVSVAVADTDSPPFDGVVGLSALGSGEIDLVGRLSELLDRLEATLAELRVEHTPRELAQVLLDAAELLTATDDEHAWQTWQLRSTIQTIVADSAAAPDVELAPAEFRTVLAGRLGVRPTRANFRSGAITVCAPAPMRAVPYRVICLLGFDDGAFPRRVLHDGDDLLSADPQAADRNPRREDRQVLLDALTNAGDALIVTYTGNDERTNAVRPPAVVIGELLDAIDASVRLAPRGGEGADPLHAGLRPRARDQIRIVHPLAACDPINFTPGALGTADSWSFDQTALAGAQAARRSRTPLGPLFSNPLPAIADENLLVLEDLLAFVAHPVRAFFRKRLDLRFGDQPSDADSRQPVELDGLQRHAIGQRLLAARLRGIDGPTALAHEQALGSLPPWHLARAALEWISPRVNALTALAGRTLEPEATRSISINFSLDDGIRITGMVTGIRGSQLGQAQFARLSPTHRMQVWVKLLSLSAMHPELPFSAVTIARTPRIRDSRVAKPSPNDDVIVSRLAALGTDPTERQQLAREQLSSLVELWRAGMRQPLPLPPRSAAAYAAAKFLAQRSAYLAEDPFAAAQQEWQSTFTYDGEDREPEHQLAFGERSPLQAMPDYAMALWQGLLDHSAQGS